MELDLNQEPLDAARTSMTELGSILDELESAHGHIHDRIRHLEAVTSRARQRHRWPPFHSPIQITNFTGEATTADVQDGGRENQEIEEGESKGTHLIAKALGVEADVGKVEGGSGNFFDCNICLDIARNPVLTCCGHLFCWSCFYQLSYAYSNAKECPVCKGEVTEKGIIPIYGNGSGTSNCQSESKEASLKVPPRPQAPRVESIRQQLISQGASSSTIRNLRRFHSLISGRGERVRQEIPNVATGRNNGERVRPEIPNVATGRNNVPVQSHPEMDNNLHGRPQPISRLLVQGTASFPSLSSAINSAERLVEDLESYVHGHHIGGSMQLNSHAPNTFSTFNVAAANHSENLSRYVPATDSAAAASASVSPLRINDDTAIQTTDSSVQILLPDPPSSSNRRRTRVSRRDSNEPRRRRFR